MQGVSFIDLLKEMKDLSFENVKLQYANEINVQIFRIGQNYMKTPEIESAKY